MSVKRWIDVSPSNWFYRAVVEADSIYLDSSKTTSLFSGRTYNGFVAGKPRKVVNFTATEGQSEFTVQGYKPDSREIVTVYVNNIPYPPYKLAENKVVINYPLAGGAQVSIAFSGVVRMSDSDSLQERCSQYPVSDQCSAKYPSVRLDMADHYVFNVNYVLNEVAVCLGKKLKRVDVVKQPSETLESALKRVFGHKDDCFTIINGVLYVPYIYNEFPVYVNYNYKAGANIKNRQREVKVPTSNCVDYSDRFFPNVTLSRAEFFTLLQRMRDNLYQRYTDSPNNYLDIDDTSRFISDKEDFVHRWYARDVLNILEEQFNDGCYVIPLYDDNSLQPDVCITRAETVVYLHRFIEWALEKFR